MDKFLNLVISGLVTGAIYSIMASGIVLTYQTSGIFNFSHGAVAFVCAYVYYQLHVGNDVPIVPALILSVFIFAPLLGLLLDKVLLRYGAGPEILHEVSFALTPGSFHFLVGPSGAGKSSLLRIMYLALKPWSGLVSLFGRDVSGLARRDCAITGHTATPR